MSQHEAALEGNSSVLPDPTAFRLRLGPWSLRQVPSKGRPCLPASHPKAEGAFSALTPRHGAGKALHSSTAMRPNGAAPDNSLPPNLLSEHRHGLPLTRLTPQRWSPFQRLIALPFLSRLYAKLLLAETSRSSPSWALIRLMGVTYRGKRAVLKRNHYIKKKKCMENSPDERSHVRL